MQPAPIPSTHQSNRDLLIPTEQSNNRHTSPSLNKGFVNFGNRVFKAYYGDRYCRRQTHVFTACIIYKNQDWSRMTRLLGSMCEGRRVPAVTIFGWDDVLCPTTHAKIDRDKHMDQAFAVAAAKSNIKRKEASLRFLILIHQAVGALDRQSVAGTRERRKPFFILIIAQPADPRNVHLFLIKHIAFCRRFVLSGAKLRASQYNLPKSSCLRPF